jgi:predicted RNA binding protein YcfA (HicA-like mRNA interferase family)
LKLKLKPTKPEKVIKALTKLGFQKVRQKGSHIVMKHPDGRITVVPFHKGEELGRGILREIIKDVGIDKEEFLKILKKV